MSNQDLPKVLIVSRVTWDDTRGTSSTLSNLFADYDPEKLAHIYIETRQPNTRCCHRFFQISEFSLIHKLYKWRTKTGHAIDTKKADDEKVDERIASQEAAAMHYVRGHRSAIYSFMREALWAFNGWKSKELEQFIVDFNPDVVWMDGSPLLLMNRLYDHVLKIAKKPASIFMQDDVYTYESCGKDFLAKVKKHRLRRLVKRVVKQCDNMFVASPKMKREYDEIFGVNSTFIAKSIDYNDEIKIGINIHQPLRMVYMGQVIYGRIYSLIAIANTLKKINASGEKLQLSIYTNNQISDKLKSQLMVPGSVNLCDPVPYTEVQKVIANNDIVVFVESFDPRYCKVARLSFSTKICDYLASGKCILAVGPADSAPLEYFKEEDAAIVATSADGIEEQILRLSNQQAVEDYAQKAHACALRNHDRKRMDDIIYNKLIELAKQ